MKQVAGLVLIGLITLASCKKADQDRLNRISYSITSTADLPVDTASRFDLFYLNEDKVIDTILDVHRFGYSFSTYGAGKGWLKAISRDSVLLRGVIIQNGLVIEEKTGYEVVVESDFR